MSFNLRLLLDQYHSISLTLNFNNERISIMNVNFNMNVFRHSTPTSKSSWHPFVCETLLESLIEKTNRLRIKYSIQHRFFLFQRSVRSHVSMEDVVIFEISVTASQDGLEKRATLVRTSILSVNNEA